MVNKTKSSCCRKIIIYGADSSKRLCYYDFFIKIKIYAIKMQQKIHSN